MSNNNLIILNCTDKNRCNCVKWVRDRVPRLPFGLWTINDKKKIINAKNPKKGRVAIMNVGLPWGHVGIVTDVKERKITIKEANYKFCKVTERQGTKSELKILGFFSDKK